jgi:hypothetical protein
MNRIVISGDGIPAMSACSAACKNSGPGQVPAETKHGILYENNRDTAPAARPTATTLRKVVSALPNTWIRLLAKYRVNPASATPAGSPSAHG